MKAKTLRKRLSAWFLRKLQKLVDQGDGPIVPDRYRVFAEAVDARASREEWLMFASGLAAQAYRDGYRAGMVYVHEQQHVWPQYKMPVPPEPAYRLVPPQHPLASVPPHLVPEMMNRLALLTDTGVTAVVIPEVRVPRHGQK